jgi:hypothetical protein
VNHRKSHRRPEADLSQRITNRGKGVRHSIPTYSSRGFFADCGMTANQESQGGSDEAVEEIKWLVLEFETSGLQQSEFCRNHGLALSTLQRQLKRRRFYNVKQRLGASSAERKAVGWSEWNWPGESTMEIVGRPVVWESTCGQRSEAAYFGKFFRSFFTHSTRGEN